MLFFFFSDFCWFFLCDHWLPKPTMELWMVEFVIDIRLGSRPHECCMWRSVRPINLCNRAISCVYQLYLPVFKNTLYKHFEFSSEVFCWFKGDSVTLHNWAASHLNVSANWPLQTVWYHRLLPVAGSTRRHLKIFLEGGVQMKQNCVSASFDKASNRTLLFGVLFAYPVDSILLILSSWYHRFIALQQAELNVLTTADNQAVFDENLRNPRGAQER